MAPIHSWPWHYMEVSGQRHALATLYLQVKDPRYRRLDEPQSRSGHKD
jgi:hypothetical protein